MIIHNHVFWHWCVPNLRSLSRIEKESFSIENHLKLNIELENGGVTHTACTEHRYIEFDEEQTKRSKFADQ